MLSRHFHFIHSFKTLLKTLHVRLIVAHVLYSQTQCQVSKLLLTLSKGIKMPTNPLSHQLCVLSSVELGERVGIKVIRVMKDTSATDLRLCKCKMTSNNGANVV